MSVRPLHAALCRPLLRRARKGSGAPCQHCQSAPTPALPRTAGEGVGNGSRVDTQERPAVRVLRNAAPLCRSVDAPGKPVASATYRTALLRDFSLYAGKEVDDDSRLDGASGKPAAPIIHQTAPRRSFPRCAGEGWDGGAPRQAATHP